MTASRLAAAFLLLAGLPAGPAHAADAEGHYAIRGAGAITCQNLTSAEGSARATARHWMEGYLTAMNRASEDTFDLAAIQRPDLVFGLLLRACAAAPELTVETAFARLLNELAPARVRAESQLLQITMNETQISIRAETLARMQEALQARGLLDEAEPGVYDGATRAALRAFQEEAGLPATQAPDTLTLLRLLL